MSLARALESLAGCAATILVFLSCRRLHARVRSVLTLPVLVTAALLVAILVLGRIDVGRYAEATRPIAWWLGPATVALAVPMHRERARVRRHARAVLVAVVGGAVTSIAAVLSLGALLRLTPVLVRSLAPKSVTTPIAMPIAESIGGVAPIAAAAVIVTGVLGMAVGPQLLALARVRSPIARGLAMGTSSHGIGTARAFDEGPLVGAMSGVAMILSGLTTALLLPAIMRCGP